MNSYVNKNRSSILWLKRILTMNHDWKMRDDRWVSSINKNGKYRRQPVEMAKLKLIREISLEEMRLSSCAVLYLPHKKVLA